MEAVKKYGPYLFFILPALAFAAAGAGKLAGVPELHMSFQKMGLPVWFGYCIGACEAAGAIGLLMTPTRKLAAAGLSVIMVGAAYYHIQYNVPSPVPALALLGLCALTMYWDWKPFSLDEDA